MVGENVVLHFLTLFCFDRNKMLILLIANEVKHNEFSKQITVAHHNHYFYLKNSTKSFESQFESHSQIGSFESA